MPQNFNLQVVDMHLERGIEPRVCTIYTLLFNLCHGPILAYCIIALVLFMMEFRGGVRIPF